mmetsp:Transcript_85771/g.142156  ORF Transcript_85771/g.142156 Transcript_85771/m.142156 type:complete len:85 (-) Transcript_85771:74-328(-)
MTFIISVVPHGQQRHGLQSHRPFVCLQVQQEQAPSQLQHPFATTTTVFCFADALILSILEPNLSVSAFTTVFSHEPQVMPVTSK